jgi:hypothetical protein
MNPGPFVREDGPQIGAIVVMVGDSHEPPPANYFSMAATQFNLGCPRISEVVPYLEPFDPVAIGWRNATVGPYTFFTNREPNAFPI